MPPHSLARHVLHVGGVPGLIAGHVGLLSLSHAAFFAIGAYSTAILGGSGASSLLVAVAVACVVAALLALVLAAAASRFIQEEAALATFALQLLVYKVLLNWNEVTGGPRGIVGVPSPELFDVVIEGPLGTAVLSVGGVATLTFGLVSRLAWSPFGRTLRAAREDEAFVASVGHSVLRLRAPAVATGCSVAAVAGCIYAFHIGYVDPTPFSVWESLLIFAMVALGGMRTRWGAPAGAAVFILVPELLRFAGFPTEVAGHLRQLLFALALVVLPFLVGPPAEQRRGGEA